MKKPCQSQFNTTEDYIIALEKYAAYLENLIESQNDDMCILSKRYKILLDENESLNSIKQKYNN